MTLAERGHTYKWLIYRRHGPNGIQGEFDVYALYLDEIPMQLDPAQDPNRFRGDYPLFEIITVDGLGNKTICGEIIEVLTDCSVIDAFKATAHLNNASIIMES
jgi:hypothetical protein